jgi:tripartite ATP-independent transporter DctM subunit
MNLTGLGAPLVGLAGLGAFFALLFLRLPVAMTMLVTGFLGIAALNGWPAALATLSGEAFEIAATHDLSVIPLFMLMGNLAGQCGMSRDLYNAANAWVGHRRGGLAAATIVGCAGFAALNGSSLASAVTMGRVALPEMKRFNYDDGLATGCVAAGGTLGILIPPSSGFVLFAILTEQSIAKLFMAGILPGLLLTALFLATIALRVGRNPSLGPAGPRSGMPERWAALGRAWPFLAIALLTIGGMYGGVMTPVEASGVGAFLAFGVALARHRISRESLVPVVLDTLRNTALTVMILIGAHLFIPFLALSQLPARLVALLAGLPLGPSGILLVILAAYIAMGTFMEGIALLVLTLPVTYPVLVQLGYHPVWLGVVLVIVLEMGLIDPPVGINVFVVKGVAPEVPLATIFRGIWPFWLAMLLALLLLVAFPQIALFLPAAMS